MKYKPTSRRNFIKTGLLFSAFGAIPMQNSIVTSEPPGGLSKKISGKTEERIEKIMLKYGPEFGDIKSFLRRN